MQEPWISLVLTTYKRPGLLREALDSINRSQVSDNERVEVIVVDNNSHDETADVVAEQQRAGFAFVLRYALESEQGVSAARNCGIRLAKGAYVVFMDDDQRIDPHYLVRVHEQFELTGADCIGGAIEYYNADGLPAWLPPLLETTGQLHAGDEIKTIHSSEIQLRGGNMAFRRQSLVESGGYDKRLGRIGDELLAGEEPELQERMQKAGYRIAYTPYLIQYHYLRPERLTRAYWRRHYFDYGRTVFRQKQAASVAESRLFMGVPCWLWLYFFRRDLPGFAAGAFLRDDVVRLERQLRVWFRLGQMCEARASSRSSEAGTNAP